MPAKPPKARAARPSKGVSRQRVAKRRSPTKAEAGLLDDACARDGLRPTRLRIARQEREVGAPVQVLPDHDDIERHMIALCDLFASTSGEFTSDSIAKIANAVSPGGAIDNTKLNAGMALVAAVAPQNELEAALAVQMAATHSMSLEMLRRASTASHVDGLREYGNLATKLQRTFTAQIKTLADWRRGGVQEVRHVHVYEGGQAVVAETVLVGGQTEKGANNAYEQHPHGPRGPALLGQDPTRDGVPVPCDAERAVSNPRRSQPRRRPTCRKSE